MTPWLIISWGFKKRKVINACRIAVFSAIFLQCQGLEVIFTLSDILIYRIDNGG